MSNLPPIVDTQKKLLFKAELPSAKCKHLSELLAMLKADKNIDSIITDWDSEVVRRNQIAHQNTANSVGWIREKFLKLKQSRWKDHPIIRDTLELAETIIFCKPSPSGLEGDDTKLNEYNRRIIQLATSHIYPRNGFVGPVLNMLDAVAQLVAEFGEEEIFKEWAELESIKGRLYLSKIIPGVSANQAKRMKLSEISAKAGFGFVQFQIENSKNKEQDPIVSYHQFRLIRLMLPSYVKSCISNFLPEALSAWTESRDTDPVTLYQYLKILSEYDFYKELFPDQGSSPMTWEEHELLAVHLSLKEYFRPFSSLDPKVHPISSFKIDNLVDTFLNMIEIKLLKSKNSKYKKRPNKSAAKGFTDKEIRIYLNSLGKKIDPAILKSNGVMRAFLIDIAQNRGETFVGDLTPPLVENVYRSVLKEKGIVRKGGAPTKRKT